MTRVVVIATGGTIATSTGQDGIARPTRSATDLVGGLGTGVQVDTVDLMSVDSSELTPTDWDRIRAAVLAAGDADGIVITHGTDTMEETAYFLNLTVKSDKPVILAGSMRPSNAISADGPANLYNAVAAAASAACKGMGVLCCMNNQLLDAKTVIKTHTIDCDTFEGGPSGIVGYVYNGEAHILQIPGNRHTKRSEFDVSKLDRLPQVGIVYSYANASPLPLQAFIDAKFDGVVIAGVGDGNIYKDLFDVAVKAQKKGVQIVRSSRCPTGPTCLNSEIDDNKYHFVASLDLNPQKARILLMLALTKTHKWDKIQEYFKQY